MIPPGTLRLNRVCFIEDATSPDSLIVRNDYDGETLLEKNLIVRNDYVGETLLEKEKAGVFRKCFAIKKHLQTIFYKCLILRVGPPGLEPGTL